MSQNYDIQEFDPNSEIYYDYYMMEGEDYMEKDIENDYYDKDIDNDWDDWESEESEDGPEYTDDWDLDDWEDEDISDDPLSTFLKSDIDILKDAMYNEDTELQEEYRQLL